MSLPFIPCPPEATNVLARLAFVHASKIRDGVPPQSMLIALGGAVKPFQFRDRAALGHGRTQNRDVVILAEPLLRFIERFNVLAQHRTGGFEQSQLIPQSFDLLPPPVEVVAPTMFQRPCERCAAFPIRDAKPRTE